MYLVNIKLYILIVIASNYYYRIVYSISIQFWNFDIFELYNYNSSSENTTEIV